MGCLTSKSQTPPNTPIVHRGRDPSPKPIPSHTTPPTSSLLPLLDSSSPLPPNQVIDSGSVKNEAISTCMDSSGNNKPPLHKEDMSLFHVPVVIELGQEKEEKHAERDYDTVTHHVHHRPPPTEELKYPLPIHHQHETISPSTTALQVSNPIMTPRNSIRVSPARNPLIASGKGLVVAYRQPPVAHPLRPTSPTATGTTTRSDVPSNVAVGVTGEGTTNVLMTKSFHEVLNQLGSTNIVTNFPVASEENLKVPEERSSHEYPRRGSLAMKKVQHFTSSPIASQFLLPEGSGSHLLAAVLLPSETTSSSVSGRPSIATHTTNPEHSSSNSVHTPAALLMRKNTSPFHPPLSPGAYNPSEGAHQYTRELSNNMMGSPSLSASMHTGLLSNNVRSPSRSPQMELLRHPNFRIKNNLRMESSSESTEADDYTAPLPDVQILEHRPDRLDVGHLSRRPHPGPSNEERKPVEFWEEIGAEVHASDSE